MAQAKNWLSLNNEKVAGSPTNPRLKDALRLTAMRLYGDAELYVWTQPAEEWSGSLMAWAKKVKANGGGWLSSSIDRREVRTGSDMKENSLEEVLERCGDGWCEPKSTAAADWSVYFGVQPQLRSDPWNLWLPPGEAKAPLTEKLQLRADGNFFMWAVRTSSTMYLVAFATS